LALVPAQYHVDFWKGRLIPWNGAVGQWLGHSPWKSSRETSGLREFSARGLKRLFDQFLDHRIHKRGLRSRELPWLWRALPRSWMERLMGRFLILKAFKPVQMEQPIRHVA
jgi:hypothetical protein